MPRFILELRNSHEFWLLVLLIVVIVCFTSLNGDFLTLRNTSDMVVSTAYVGILCSGLLVVLIAGGIDVSFTASASIAQYAALTFVNRFGGDWFLLIVIACLIGVLCGMMNAVLIYRFRIKSIIATIAMLNVLYGLLIAVTDGRYISLLPPWFEDGVSWFELSDVDGITYSINLQIALLLLSFGFTWVLLRRSNVGRQIYAMGGNPEAARRMGFGVFRLHLIVYGYMGFTAGLASIAQSQLALQVMPSALVGKELDVLAAVVLGGASLIGGVGTIFGTILGVSLLAVMQTGLLMVGVSSYWLQFFSGLVIVVAMSITAVQLQRSKQLRRLNA
ncbi:sugar ABC transporter permease [Rhizobium sp. Root1203]|uniref:ABC transporter permease n=1 Tax=Rhizobium sp. Root1203 TaxID=1736427 RepID=UPI00071052EC|nr:ABC transporter permease [Rhizobium sp. Root1203]KQV14336.1 sugar ABC transporter permease [Rhizobium sp. Root1203]